jgi:hypothetical protein
MPNILKVFRNYNLNENFKKILVRNNKIQYNTYIILIYYLMDIIIIVRIIRKLK